MEMKRVGGMVAVAMLAVASMGGTASAATDGPTCSDTLGIAVHGQHVVGDYVTGIGHDNLDWPPAGQVGTNTSDGGAAIPGGPGPRFHFPRDIPPGASFCTDSAQSVNATLHQQASDHVPPVH